MSFIYLSSPYSHEDPVTRTVRFHAALQKAATLMAQGHVVYSPIAHSHPISQYLPKENCVDHEFWMAQDLPLLRLASKLVVLRIPSWEASRGVGVEVKEAERLGIPVEYIDEH